MKNVPSRATGEAMPSLTRRLFLRGAAVIAPLAALPALPALAARTSDYVEENPALLALEPRIDAASSAYVTASAEYDQAFTVGSKLWPRAPREIKEERYVIADDAERDIEGRPYDYGDNWSEAQITTSALIRYELRNLKGKRSAARVELRERLLRNLPIAETYEAECENARVVSGFPAAAAAKTEATNELEALVRLIRAEPARTMAGVMIKARAFSAWSQVPACRRVLESIENDLASDVAASLLAILNDQSA